MRAHDLQHEVLLKFVEDANVVGFSFDKKGAITIWNRKIALLSGYSSGDVLGSQLEVNSTRI